MKSPEFTNKTTEYNLQNDIRYYPLDSRELASKFSTNWVNDCGNTTSDRLLMLWEHMFEYINESYYRNVSDIDKRYMVVPAPTGSGKTQCFRFYAAELAKKEFDEDERPGMLIVTTFIDEINEAVEQINTQAGSKVAAAYHSKSPFKTEQEERLVNDYQIVVMSHQYYIRNHYLKAINNDVYQQVANYKDKPRPIIVVDESIELIKHIGIDRSTIDSIKYNITPLYESGNNELKNECQLIKYIHRHFDNLFSDEPSKDKVRLVADKEKLLSVLSKELALPIDRIKQLFKLTQFVEILKGNQLYQINKAVTGSGKKDLLEDVVDFHHLLDDSLYLYQNKGTITYRASALELPEQSLVVLDATANVDVFYKDFPHTRIYTVPPVKTYEQVSIKLIETNSKLGKTTLRKNSQLHWDNLFFHLMDGGMDSDNTVVFVQKDLLKALGEDRYKIDNFGNLVGVNQYKDCTNVLIYGIHYKPDFVYYDNLHQSTKDKGNNTFTKESKDKILELKYSNIAAEIIQAINRGCCRYIVDGKAPKMNVQLLLPNNKRLSKVIVDSIESEMTGVVANRVKYPLEFDIKEDKTKPPAGKDMMLINCIDNNLDDIKLSDLCTQAGIDTKKPKERVIRNLTKPEFSNTYLAVEVSKLGYKVEKKGQWYLVKH